MSGLFGTFNVAKRGMSVQQRSIDVTSHNIANANTEGYSRQRAKIETSRPFGMPSINSVAEPGQLGTGSQIASIERIRDSFLDFQVRNETSTYGNNEARQKFLTEIESIFNEPSDTGISTLIGKFYDAWQQLSKQPQSSNSRTVVAQQSAALTDELNHSYNQLIKLKDNAQSNIKNTIVDVNSILNQVNALNQQIMQVKVAGNMPNDLMDKRDLLLDELSSKFSIRIDRKNFEGINLTLSDLTSNGYAENGLQNPSLVNSIITNEEKRIGYISSIEKINSTEDFPTDLTITYYKDGDMSTDENKRTMILVDVTEEQYKNIDQCRALWISGENYKGDKTNEGYAVRDDGSIIENGDSILGSEINLFEPSNGELYGLKSIQKDIDDYVDQLNRLAKSIAFSVNAVHSGETTAGNDTMLFFVNKKDATPIGEADITAGNIGINEEILNDVMKINTKTSDEYGETDGSRALAIAQLRDVLIKIQDINGNNSATTIHTREDMFDPSKGKNTLNGLVFGSNTDGMKVDNYFKDTIDKLGVQSQEAKRIVKNQEALLSSFEESRLSVSGVSLDEEMANLVQFQHAYQANAKMIATVDELLDVVVNGLKR